MGLGDLAEETYLPLALFRTLSNCESSRPLFVGGRYLRTSHFQAIFGRGPSRTLFCLGTFGSMADDPFASDRCGRDGQGLGPSILEMLEV